MVRVNNLEAEMKRKGISRNDIAKHLGLSYKTIHSKFDGESQWQYTECILIRDIFFPGLDLAYLFPYSQKEPEKEVV